MRQYDSDPRREHIMGPSFSKQNAKSEDKQPLDDKKDYSSTDKDSSRHKSFSTNTFSFLKKQGYARYN